MKKLFVIFSAILIIVAAANSSKTKTAAAADPGIFSAKQFLNESNIHMQIGTITTACHKSDFSGYFIIKNSIGYEYLVETDPEDLETGDNVLFITELYSGCDIQYLIDPAFCDVIYYQYFNNNNF